MASVSFEQVYKIYDGGVEAVKDFNLEIADKEFVVFVGPSGCGKSTTLRMVAGLESISRGRISIDGLVVNDMEPKDRDIAMVFQNYALYPHMTVRDNMSYALRLKKTPQAEIDKKVKEAAQILGLEEYLDRKPKALSGGQRQRVALGRAIVRHPKVFLMDEPLSNLDAKLRVQTRSEIIKLHEKLETTFIYVTHDQTEAMTMGDRIVIMKDGVIQQVDTPHNVYFYPANMFVAGFIGSPQMNLVDVKVSKGGGSYTVDFLGYELALPQEKGELLEKRGKLNRAVVMGVRPEHMYDMHRKTGLKIEGRVDLVEMSGSEKFLHLELAGTPLVAKVASDNPIRGKEDISLYLDEDKLHFFDKESKNNLMLGENSL